MAKFSSKARFTNPAGQMLRPTQGGNYRDLASKQLYKGPATPQQPPMQAMPMPGGPTFLPGMPQPGAPDQFAMTQGQQKLANNFASMNPDVMNKLMTSMGGQPSPGIMPQQPLQPGILSQPPVNPQKLF